MLTARTSLVSAVPFRLNYQHEKEEQGMRALVLMEIQKLDIFLVCFIYSLLASVPEVKVDDFWPKRKQKVTAWQRYCKYISDI